MEIKTYFKKSNIRKKKYLSNPILNIGLLFVMISFSSAAQNIVAIRRVNNGGVGNCIPFGGNDQYGFTGFVYRNVPAFVLHKGDKIRFDLGSLNDVDVRRNIYFSDANINPSPFTGSSQNVRAVNWVQVVSDAQIPINGLGNSIQDDFELTYTAISDFTFAGGGFVIGFGGAPPSSYIDENCEQVGVITNSGDASGNFYCRFYARPNLEMGVLDQDGGSLQGFIIEKGNPSPILTCPINIIIADTEDQCFANVDFAATATGTNTIITYSQDPKTLFPIGKTTVIATATNENGTDTCSFTITVQDSTPPTVVTKDIIVQLDAAGSVTVNASNVNNGSTDNCEIDLLELDKNSFTCANIGVNTVTLTATDVNGNVSSQTATVTVEDKVAAVVLTKDITVQLDALGDVSIVAADVNNGSADACGIDLLELDKTSFTCANVGENTVTLTATDVNGNVSFQTATVTVEDKVAAVVVTKDITVQLDTTGNTTIAPADVNNDSTDACGIALLELDKTSFTCANVGANTVTLTATDVNGNVSFQTAIVTVEDKVSAIVVTKDITVQLDATGNATIAPADVDNGSMDACGIDLLELDKTSFKCANVGVNTVTLKVTDVNGNVATQTAIVTVEDKITPVAITKNITVQLNAAGNATLVAADVNNGSTDSCGIATLALDKTSFSCANVGVNTVILTVTDNNRNVATQTAIVTVEDKVAPVVITKNKTIQLNAAGTASIVVADVNNGSTDNCGISLVELDKMAFTCANVGANTVTLKVTDNNGNVATQTAIITVEDRIAPVVITKNITVQLDASSNILIAATDVNNGSTDNCGIRSLELDKALFSCADVGDNIVTLKVTDNSGNVATKTAIVTVVNTRPNIIRKHFDDVIFFDNSSKAFIAYSWYKNGVLVSGQTAQYFKDNGILNGSYYAIAKKTDGTFVTTCPLTFSVSIVDEYLKIAPNPVKSNASYQILTNVDSAKLQNARITVFTILGVLVNDKMVDGKTTDMIAPNTEGIYVVRMTLGNGKYFTKNLLVKN